jgi:putative drug exporter of the RND superfamily
MSRIARWCVRHRRTVLAVWLLLLVGTALASRSLGTEFTNGFTLPGTESTQALELLAASHLGVQGGDDTIVFHSTSGPLTDPDARAAIDGALAAVSQLPIVTSVRGPFDPASVAQVSADQTVAFAVVTLAAQNQDLAAGDVQPLVTAALAVRSSTLEVEFGGLGFQTLKGSPVAGSELIGVAIAALVLLVAFGSLLAAAVPLIAALLAVGTAVELIGLLSRVVSVNALAPTVAALIGLGVAIDYALFVVARHRSGLRAGLSPEEAAVLAVATSGRAVVFAGATVSIAMLGLLLLQVDLLTGVGIAAAVVVLCAVAAAITLLPALFGFLGLRILGRAQRRQLQDGSSDGVIEDRGPWARWAAFVQRRPVVLGLLASAVMALLIIPSFSIRLGSSDQGNDPASSTTRKAYDLLAQGFGPGSNGPLELVAVTPAASDRDALTQLATRIRGVPGVASVATPRALPGGDVSIMVVTPNTSPQSPETETLIDSLRQDVIPPVEARTTLRVYVGGQTAIFQDFAGVLAGKLPLFIAVVVLLGCLLLMIAFRSIVIPLTAAAMNLLAAGASVGVVVAVFQWGGGSEALGLGKPGPIEAFLPVMLIAILFGLSMDYQVFLVSRMHEEWVRTGDNSRAVRTGQAETGRVITAAAAIMVAVFMAFVLGGRRPIGEFGLGLATAILLDAVLLRTILVPAAMQLIGRANWWLPSWLDRALPRIAVDAPSAAPIAVPLGDGV